MCYVQLGPFVRPYALQSVFPSVRCSRTDFLVFSELPLDARGFAGSVHTPPSVQQVRKGHVRTHMASYKLQIATSTMVYQRFQALFPFYGEQGPTQEV